MEPQLAPFSTAGPQDALQLPQHTAAVPRQPLPRASGCTAGSLPPPSTAQGTHRQGAPSRCYKCSPEEIILLLTLFQVRAAKQVYLLPKQDCTLTPPRKTAPRTSLRLYFSLRRKKDKECRVKRYLLIETLLNT